MFGQLIPLKKIADKFNWYYNSFVPKTSVKTRRQCYNYGFSCTPRLFSTDSRIAEKQTLVILPNVYVEVWIFVT